ncbi:MAG: hypothetical protein AAFR91_08415 [Pseudomonadota bacterium]
MAVNLGNLSVISGNRNSSARGLRIHGTEDRELTQHLNQLLQTSGTDTRVRLEANPGVRRIVCDAASVGLASGLHITHARGLKGVNRSLAASVEWVVVSYDGDIGESLMSPGMLRHLAERFGLTSIVQLRSEQGETTEEIAPGASSTLSEWIQSVSATPERRELVVAPQSIYESARQIALGLTNSSEYAISATVSDVVTIKPVNAAEPDAMLVPLLFTALWLSGERNAAATLECAWLSTLEAGILPEGVDALRPYSSHLPRQEFMEAVSSRVGAAPRQLRTSLPLNPPVRPELSIVRS